jgi:hypothetical protein
VLSIVTTLPVPNLVRLLIECFKLSFPTVNRELYELKDENKEIF